jgi:hypothetical protein
MTLLLVKLLVLKMLFDDNEPLNLILKEALITEDNMSLLKDGFQKQQIVAEDIKCALKELKNGNMIKLLSENGKFLDCDECEFNQILNSNEEWKYWFKITKSGEKFFNDNYQTYFREDSFN